MCGLATQEVYIRSATQTIFAKFLIEHLEVSHNYKSLFSFGDFLFQFDLK